MTTSTAVQHSYRDYVGEEWIDTPERDVVRLPYDGTPVGEVRSAGLDMVEAAVGRGPLAGDTGCCRGRSAPVSR